MMTPPESETPESKSLRVISVTSEDLRWATQWLEDHKDLVWEGVAELHCRLREAEEQISKLREADRIFMAEAAERGNASVVEDAARYRWLRDGARHPFILFSVGTPLIEECGSVDAAIDRARLGGKKDD